MIDRILSVFADIIRGGSLFALFSALAAGVLTSFMPCCLSALPLIIGYVGATGEKSTKKAFLYSAVYALGNALVFAALGLLAATAGRILGGFFRIWYIILGILMALMSLQTFGIYEFIPSARLLGKNTKRGVVGAFIAGLLGGLFSSPCSTPVLVALLAVAAGRGSIIWGAVLMLFYGMGNGAFCLIAGTSVGFVQKLKQSEKYARAEKVIKTVMGVLILLIGLYMFYMAF